MSRSPVLSVRDSRQLDFFGFASPASLADRSRPYPTDATALRLIPFPVTPVIELPEIQFEQEPVRPTEPIVPRSTRFQITVADHLGEGSLRQKCEGNLTAIALLKRLEPEGRGATGSELRALVRYVGWGGLRQVFNAANAGWQDQRQRLEELLTSDELASARATTLNAHYPSPTIIGAIYGALERFGFLSGRVLEPACGLGHFLGLMPDGMRSRSTFTGIEIDSLTARLAKALYPDADLRHSAFEDAKLADDFYDVAISNVPFGDYRPFDPRFPRFLIHDYFFAATLAKVRPGGLMAFITSRGTFEKEEFALREFVARQADLLGAIRLPDDAFKRNANTEVTTDIVFLRKRQAGEARAGPAWQDIVPTTNSLGETILLNEYFAGRPERMLGEMRLAGRMYRQSEPTWVGNGRDLGEQLHSVLQSLPAAIYQPVEPPPAVPGVALDVPAPEEVKPNAFTLHQGQLAKRQGDQGRHLPRTHHRGADRTAND